MGKTEFLNMISTPGAQNKIPKHHLSWHYKTRQAISYSQWESLHLCHSLQGPRKLLICSYWTQISLWTETCDSSTYIKSWVRLGSLGNWSMRVQSSCVVQMSLSLLIQTIWMTTTLKAFRGRNNYMLLLSLKPRKICLFLDMSILKTI